jgi:hypothetical protein
MKSLKTSGLTSKLKGEINLSLLRIDDLTRSLLQERNKLRRLQRELKILALENLSQLTLFGGGDGDEAV